jgi:hypothetical protein
VTLYFFERITDEEFVGPIVVAAPTEDEAWLVLEGREKQPRDVLRGLGWDIAQDLAALPARASIVYPRHYRRAILQ